MKHLSSTWWLLSVLVLLCSCGGGVGPSHSPSTSASGPAPQGVNIAGNWQLSTRSTAGMPSITIAGSIHQSGSSITGAVHVDGWNCFDQRATLELTGTLTSGNVSLASAPVDGQVISVAGSIRQKTGFPDALTGTYAIDGGCGNGERGNVSGYRVDSITGYCRS